MAAERPPIETKLIDGRAIAAQVQAELKVKVEELVAGGAPVPRLVVVIVGDRKDSRSYVKMKVKTAAEVGIASELVELAESATEAELLATVDRLNADASVTSILVQLPLPSHMNEARVLDAISLEKDVDGFHPQNIGSLAMRGRNPLAVACTPKGCIELLRRSGVTIEGKHAVVLGRSNIVGIPAALCLLRENATVTVCHSRTANLKEEVQKADILIAAVGHAELVRGDWLRPGVVVIDVAMNTLDDPSKKAGFRFVGDVSFAEAQGVASLITPVPGGVGPMTVAMLMSNTYEAAVRARASALAGSTTA
eukprot:a843951_62.p1 GENE.a843951_62~~a843951_62.p1  ORF type:complete len:321 (-),score=120.13 a843951_62:139-1065(-)